MSSLRQNLLFQFSVVSFVVMAVIAVALSTVMSGKIRSDAIGDLVDEAVGHASERIPKVITPADLEVPMTGERYDRFQKFVRHFIVSDRTARIKLWARDGTVIYSNDPASVGEKFPVTDHLLKALGGENSIAIKTPTDPENVRERHLGTLMEVYTPIIFPGSVEPQGAFEIYLYYEPTAQRINYLRGWTVGLIGLGFMVLYVGLVSIVWRGWRTMVGQQGALADTNAQLQEANRQLSTLYSITATSSETLDLDIVLREVVKKITAIFHFDATRIFLFNAAMDELHLRASFETQPEYWAEIRVFRPGQGNVGRVAESGEPFICESVQRDPRYQELSHSKATQRTGHDFLAVFPIKSKLRTVGTIVCIGKDPRRLTAGEIQLISSMAGQIGVAVENAKLFEETQARDKKLSALFSIAAIVNQSLDIDLVLRSVMHKVLEIFGFDAARVYLLHEDRKELRLLAHEGFPDDAIPAGSYRPGEGFVGRVFETGEPGLFEDIQKDPEFNRMAPHRILQRAGYRAEVFIPIAVKEKTIGVISALSRSAHRFSPDEVQVIQSIAHHLGVALENARLYQESRRREDIQGFLRELSQDITFLDVDSLLQKLTGKVRELLNVDMADVRLLEPAGWQVKGLSGVDQDSVPASHPVTPGGRSVWVAKNRRALMIPDITRGEGAAASGETLEHLGIRGYLAVPLFSREAEVIGVLRALSYQAREFVQEEIELLQQLANGAAIAIGNTSLFEEVNKQSRALQTTNYHLNRLLQEQTALREILPQINVMNMGDLLKKITEQALELLKVDHVQVRLLGEDGLLRTLALAGEGAERFQDRLQRIGRGRSTWVMKNRCPYTIKNIGEDKVFGPGHILREMGVKGYLCVPLLSRDQRSIGVLNLSTFTEREFLEDEIALAQQFSAGAAIAIENTRLFGGIEEKSRELEALVKINRDIAALLDRETLIPRIAEEASRLLRMDGATFRLVEGEDLVLASAVGPELNLQARLPISHSLSGRIASGHRVAAVRNIREDPTLIEEHREILCKAGYHSFLGAPLQLGERVIGVVNLYSKEEREFSPKEIGLIGAFADQAAIAIQNANLFAEIKDKSLELEKANQVRSDFVAAMSHELRTPLHVIIGNVGLLREGLFGEITEEQKDSLEKIMAHSEVLLKLINSVLTLAQIEEGRTALDVSTFSVEELLAHTQSAVEDLNRDRRLAVSWDIEESIPPITTDAPRLEEILQNLIANAFKFTPGGTIRILVRNLRDRSRVEFSISDTGIGIEEGELGRIFDKFYQHKQAHTGDYNGVGLGLSIVEHYLELMKGEIRVESRPDKGSVFSFSLPYSI